MLKNSEKNVIFQRNFITKHINQMNILKGLIFTILTLLASQAYSQESGTVSIGLRGGFNLSNWGGNVAAGGSGSNNYKAGLNFGAVGLYSIDEHWAMAAEINYSQKGTSPALNSFVKLNYLDIPIYINYFFGQGGDRFRTKVILGPYAAVLMTAKNKVGSIETDVKGVYNTTDFGVLAGGGFHYKFNEAGGNWLIFDVRYAVGLSDITKPALGVSNLTNRALSINVGVTFPLGN
ncbi:MAG: PorT family protein [Cytophagales bacterium]|nr:MAG: PorT family protein [Cytophagales bacterium]